MKVSIVEYSPGWQKMFEAEKQALLAVMGGFYAQVEHIGSTAVVDLAAKPIIDIMIGLPDFPAADNLVPAIEALGYEYMKKYEDEMPFRRYFARDEGGARTHQIHMVALGGEFWERHLLFRDYLLRNPATADEYAALKKLLAGREWEDVNEYADAKTKFIKDIESRAQDQASSPGAV